MQSLQTAVNVVAPMFLMLALGCLLRMGGLLDRETLERLNNVCFKVFLSLLLYYNIYTADVADIFNPRLLGFALLLQAAVWGLLFLTVPRFEKSNKRRGAMIQGIGRTNSAPCAATCARSPPLSCAGLWSFPRWRCRSASGRAFAVSSWSALSACSSRRRPLRRLTWRSPWTPTRIWRGIWWCLPPCFPC